MLSVSLGKRRKRPKTEFEGHCPWVLGQGLPATYSPADTGPSAGLVVTALQGELPSAKPRSRGLSPRAPHLGDHQAAAGRIVVSGGWGEAGRFLRGH